MKIATWNVNGMRARLDFVLHWLRSRQPDLVGFQELKLTEDKFPFREFEDEGYQAVLLGQKSWNGVGIIARDSIEVTQRGLPGQEDLGSRLIQASVAGISFTTVYCPNGKALDHPDFERKLDWFASLNRFLKENLDSSQPAVLCGDFNICPEALDSWSEETLQGSIFHTERERQVLRETLNLGWYDLFRSRHPDVQAFSWWDYRAGAFYKNQGLRIDFLLGTKPVLDTVADVMIDRDYRKKKDGQTASDHAPVIAEIEWKR